MRPRILLAPALVLVLPCAAAAQQDAFAERDRRADTLLNALETSRGTDTVALRGLETLADECERAADHRVGKYVAGQLIRYQPDQRRHLYRYVRILRARGDHEAAEQELRELVTTRPSVREGWDLLVDLLYDQGHYEEALAVYADCLKEHPDDARALHWRAWVYLWDLGDLEAAEGEVARMAAAARDSSRGTDLQAWFAGRVREMTVSIREQRAAREDVIIHERHIDRWLMATWAGVLAAAAGLFFVSRPRS